jgi:hypothetical protein
MRFYYMLSGLVRPICDTALEIIAAKIYEAYGAPPN